MLYVIDVLFYTSKEFDGLLTFVEALPLQFSKESVHVSRCMYFCLSSTPPRRASFSYCISFSLLHAPLYYSGQGEDREWRRF